MLILTTKVLQLKSIQCDQHCSKLLAKEILFSLRLPSTMWRVKGVVSIQVKLKHILILIGGVRSWNRIHSNLIINLTIIYMKDPGWKPSPKYKAGTWINVGRINISKEIIVDLRTKLEEITARKIEISKGIEISGIKCKIIFVMSMASIWEWLVLSISSKTNTNFLMKIVIRIQATLIRKRKSNIVELKLSLPLAK